MRIVLFFLCMLIVPLNIANSSRACPPREKKEARIIIEVEFPKAYKREQLTLGSAPYECVVTPSWREENPVVTGTLAKWVLFSDSPRLVDLTYILGKGNGLHLCEPGDSIHINLATGQPVISGRNAAKVKMLLEINAKEALNPIPIDTGVNKISSIGGYLKWNTLLNNKLDTLELIWAAYQSQITPLAFEYLKADRIATTEHTRLMKFAKFMNLRTTEDPGKVFDSTATNKYVKWLQGYDGRTLRGYYFYDYIRRTVERKYNFNYEHDILKSAKRKVLYAETAKTVYKGGVLQSCLTFLLTEQGLKEHTLKGNTPEIDTLLAAFYAQPGYPEYKLHVKQYEQKIRGWIVSSGMNSPDFSLLDQNGASVTKEQFAGKIILASFSHSNCKDCTEMNNALAKIQSTFNKDSNVVFLSISVDKENGSPNNKTKSVFYLSTGSRGEKHEIIKHYNISSYPQVFLIDNLGKFIYNGKPDTGYRVNTLPDPRKDKGQKLTDKIYEQLALINDGPYVMYTRDSIISNTIQGASIEKKKYAHRNAIKASFQTDEHSKKVPVVLKKEHHEEPSQYLQPEKIFTLSDIEGNFNAFRKLLQKGGIIDEAYNWTYGKGHLVFAGDMFDRGDQVTECLWLLYSLEEKAKTAGGYVHFILGNHELMNLNGDRRYMHQKYKNTEKLLNTPYQKLYAENSELGKWIRTKNIIEKIGDILIVHGGISREINNLNIPIEQINKLARAYYSNDSLAQKMSDKRITAIFDPVTSPFWNRGYYNSDASKMTPESVVDSTLEKFKVSRIITGHTIVANEISVHYSGKVINTDTRHAKGYSEALLIENNRYFRVSALEKREIIFEKITLATK